MIKEFLSCFLNCCMTHRADRTIVTFLNKRAQLSVTDVRTDLRTETYTPEPNYRKSPLLNKVDVGKK